MSIRTLANRAVEKVHDIAGTTVYLTDPDGVRTQHDDCQFLSNRTTVSPESGEEVVLVNPRATFPLASLLARDSDYTVPQDGEKWFLDAPDDPDIPDTLTGYSLDPSKAIEGGRSLGFIRLYLTKVDQS